MASTARRASLSSAGTGLTASPAAGAVMLAGGGAGVALWPGFWAALAPAGTAAPPSAGGAAGRPGTWMAAAIIRPGSAPRSMTSSSSTALITASRPSSEQATRRPLPVRTTAASWECTAARDGRSTNAVSALPVAYPVPEPSSSPARTLARRTVPSRSSRNIGTGALANMARSRRRSASVESAPWSPGRDGLGPQPRGRVDRPVQLGERGLEQLRQRGAGQGGGLPQRAGTRAERGNLALRPRSAAQVLHMKSGSLSKGGPRPPGLRGRRVAPPCSV